MANGTRVIVKVSVLLGAMMLLPGGTAAGQSRTPLPDGWLKYTDVQFGFEIAYPPDYGIVPEPASPLFGAVKRVRFQEKQLLSSEFVDLEPARFSVEVFPWSEPTPLADWVRSKDRLPPDATTMVLAMPGAREGLRVRRAVLVAPDDFFYFATNNFVYLLTPLGSEQRAMFRSFRLLARRPPRAR